MKISEMIKNLEEFKAEYGDLDCWYAKDDEGNGYQAIHYTPSKYYVDSDGEVVENLNDYDLTEEDVTPVCIVN